MATNIENKVTKDNTFETLKDSPYEKEDKVKVFIPLTSGEAPGTTLPVMINGLRLNIQKGKPVDVPKTFAEVINESLGATAMAEATAKAEASGNQI
ncbi:MAG: hypothetical protein ACRCX2_10450 [Paraclostridium sp.]